MCQVWLKLAQWFWRRFFKIFVNVFSLFRNYLTLQKGGTLHLNKIEYPLSKNALCKVWLKLAQWFLGRNFFLILTMYFRYFEIISPLKRAGPFIWINLNPLYPRMLCAKFWRRRWKCEKFNLRQRRHVQRQRRTTDKLWSEKLTWAFGSGELQVNRT